MRKKKLNNIISIIKNNKKTPKSQDHIYKEIIQTFSKKNGLKPIIN